MAAVLLWVHTGEATVIVAGIPHALSAGEAIWIPPGLEHSTVTEEGGVVLPIFVDPRPRAGVLDRARMTAVPPGWEDWLMFQFDWNSYHSLPSPTGTTSLVDLISDSPVLRDETLRHLTPPALVMPRSREALAVARTILRSPGSLRSGSEFAARENISVRTLQRQFRQESGLTFSEWRARARVTVAAKNIRDGTPIGRTGSRVGFATPAGFNRAFHRYFGHSPREFARRTRMHQSGPVRAMDHSNRVQSLVAEGAIPPPRIPARRVWDWVFDWHVLWWAYRGEANVRIGSRQLRVRRGQVVWVPAGVSASADLAEGSILLPLGNRHGGSHIGVEDVKVTTLPLELEPLLLHTALAEYTLFRPDPGRANLTDQLFRKQFAAEEVGGGVAGAVSTIARALREHPHDSRPLEAWAAQIGVSHRVLGREFLTQTGSTFPRWRSQLRMSSAREMLRFGDPIFEVSRALGYASPTSFGRVFTATHGVSPRTYRNQAMLPSP